MSADETRSRPRPRPKPRVEPTDTVDVADETSASGTATTTKVSTTKSDSSTSATAAKSRPAAKVTDTDTDTDTDEPQRRTLDSLPRWLGPGVAALLVVLLVLNVVLFLRYRSNADAVDEADARDAQSVAQTYSAALQSAKTRVPQILSYNYKTIDADIKTIGGDLTGSFKNDYTAVLSDRVKPRAVQLKVTTKSTQSGAAVVNATSDSAVSVLVFVNQQTTSGSGTPQVVGSRVQVTMKKVGNAWLISDLSVV